MIRMLQILQLSRKERGEIKGTRMDLVNLRCIQPLFELQLWTWMLREQRRLVVGLVFSGMVPLA